MAWCRDVEYRTKPNTAARIKTSFASLVDFFGTMPVGEIGPGDIERFKAHRLEVNRVREVTVRHDLHALSLFFQYAEKMRWREGNPVTMVAIPSDQDSVRITVDDDGIGFDVAARKGGGGLGLISMEERARVVHGQFLLESRPGAGACIIVEVPTGRLKRATSTRTAG